MRPTSDVPTASRTPWPSAATSATATNERSGAYEANAKAAAARAAPNVATPASASPAAPGLSETRPTPNSFPTVSPAPTPAMMPGGIEQSVDQPGTGGHRETGEGILGGAHDADAREEQDDADGDHARRVHLELRDRGGDREERRDEAPCRLLVERRDAAQGQEQLGSVDRAGRQERKQAHQSPAAQGEGDSGSHRPPADGHGPAAPEMSGGHDPGDLVPRVGPGDVTGHQVVHGQVDLDQVRVVDRAPGHPSYLKGSRFGAARLVTEGQVHERHVRGHVAHAAGLGHCEHGGRHVGRSGPRRQQDLADPQRQVE